MSGRGRFVFGYAHARAVVRLVWDAQGRVVGLWIRDVTFPGDTWPRLLADLRRLPGRVAFLARRASGGSARAVSAGPRGADKGIAPRGNALREGERPQGLGRPQGVGRPRDGGRILAALAPARALAVASAFKLFVLKAIAQEIQDGRMRWDDVVQLRSERRSLPTAPLNRWPDGTPMTVQSLATFMIARSDNTATDHLLLHVGREVVEQHAGTYNRPLLTTREMFLLKSRAHRALARQWIAAPTPAARRALLSALGRLDRRSVDLGWREPRLVEKIEWFFSPRALCDALDPLSGLPVFRPNPGLASPRRWRRVAYKGGSEPGVRSMVYVVQHPRTGRRACVGLVWNDPHHPVDGPYFDFLMRRALALAHHALGRRRFLAPKRRFLAPKH